MFTIELCKSSEGDQRAFVDLEELAADRGVRFVPVRLLCDVEELCRRVADPFRMELLNQSVLSWLGRNLLKNWF